MRKKKEKYIIENAQIIGFAAEGNAFAKQDEKVIFAPYCVPGDIVDLEVYKQKKSYCFANVLSLKEQSDKRTYPKCRHFGYCGGCSWQEMSYQWQMHFKQQQVIDNLSRIGKVDCTNISPIIGSNKIFYYRNKLEYTFGAHAWKKDYVKVEEDSPALGFHVSGRFDKVMPIDECFLQKPPSNEIRNFLRDFTLVNHISYYDVRNHSGMMRNLVIRTSERGEVMVIVVFAKNDNEVISQVMNAIKQKFPEITSLQYCINDKMNDSLSDRDFILFSGKDHILEYMPKFTENESTIDDNSSEYLVFKIRPKTFYQTNPPQAYKLYSLAAKMAAIHNDDVVYDLYTGTGTIANFVANMAKKVVGIEYVEDAVEDAKLNSKENSITNTVFYAGDMAKIFDDDFVKKEGEPDIVITDPPRNGMAEVVVKQLLKILPRRIVYISCNPATQSRDIFLMREQYDVAAIQPVDMFPHTRHIENIVLLTKK